MIINMQDALKNLQSILRKNAAAFKLAAFFVICEAQSAINPAITFSDYTVALNQDQIYSDTLRADHLRFFNSVQQRGTLRVSKLMITDSKARVIATVTFDHKNKTATLAAGKTIFHVTYSNAKSNANRGLLAQLALKSALSQLSLIKSESHENRGKRSNVLSEEQAAEKASELMKKHHISKKAAMSIISDTYKITDNAKQSKPRSEAKQAKQSKPRSEAKQSKARSTSKLSPARLDAIDAAASEAQEKAKQAAEKASEVKASESSEFVILAGEQDYK